MYEKAATTNVYLQRTVPRLKIFFYLPPKMCNLEKGGKIWLQEDTITMPKINAPLFYGLCGRMMKQLLHLQQHEAEKEEKKEHSIQSNPSEFEASQDEC